MEVLYRPPLAADGDVPPGKAACPQCGLVVSTLFGLASRGGLHCVECLHRARPVGKPQAPAAG